MKQVGNVSFIMDMETFIATQKQIMDTMSSMLKMYGIELNMEKIDVDPEDCESCIDFVYRLRCTSNAVCDELKKAIVERFGGGGEE